MKIRCQQCRKSISIDEAFAGGFCRCPYCKAITKVSGRARGKPATAERPEMPGPAQPAEGEPQEALPVANPANVRGLVALVISGLLVLLAVSAVTAYFWLIRPGGQAPADGPARHAPGRQAQSDLEEQTNPFLRQGVRVAGMEFQPPVVYLLDSSWSMSDFLDPAAAVVRYSIRSLGPQQKFNVMVAREDGLALLSEGWLSGGDEGDARAGEFFRKYLPAGAAELGSGLSRALAARPKTVVLLAAKALQEPGPLIEQARAQNTAILTVSLGAYPEVSEQFSELARQTGGDCAEFSLGRLMNLLCQAPALP